MSWNGSGVYSLPVAYFPEQAGNLVDAVRYNGVLNDIAAGLNNALTRDGQNALTGNIPCAGFRFTGASPAVTAGQFVTYEQAVGLGVAVGIIAQNSQSAAYQLVLTDAGKHIFHPAADVTARVWTIPANATVAFAIGTAITFINEGGAGVITIAITSDELVSACTGTTGSQTLAAHGVATAVKVTATKWYIAGTGLT